MNLKKRRSEEEINLVKIDNLEDIIKNIND